MSEPTTSSSPRVEDERVVPPPRRGSRGHLIALLVAALVSPIVACFDQGAAFAKNEMPGFTPRDIAILWLFYATTQCLLAVALLPAATLIWRGWWRSGWVLWLCWQLVVYVITEADRQTYARTKLHLRDYTDFLHSSTAADWAGDLDAGRYLGALSVHAARDLIALPLIGAIVVAVIVRRRCSPRAAQRTLAALVIAWLLACAGVVPAQALHGDRARLARAHASLPLNFRWSATGIAFVDTAKFERAFNKRLGNDVAGRVWRAAAPPAPKVGPLPGDARRDVVLIVLESWRADALEPVAMPRLTALADSGTRLMAHESGAKFTHFALYNLFTSRPAFSFQADVDRAIVAPAPAAAAATFRKLGYVSRFFAAADYHWRGMEHFIDNGTFRRIQTLPRGSWSIADTETIRATRDYLATPSDDPRFVVLYVVSTHFPYKYAKPYERFEPVVSAQMKLLKLGEADGRIGLRNRYRNACAFLDDELATLVSGLDLSRTVVAITGDHGESFWDDGSLTHGGRWSDIALRVPFVLAGAGVSKGGTVTTPTLHQDVVPTLLNLATGRAVPVTGALGHDALAPSDANEVRLICSEASQSFSQALFAGGDRRLLVEFPRRGGNAIVLGTVDLKGNVDPFDAPPASEAAAWADGVRAILDRFDPPKPKAKKRKPA